MSAVRTPVCSLHVFSARTATSDMTSARLHDLHNELRLHLGSVDGGSAVCIRDGRPRGRSSSPSRGKNYPFSCSTGRFWGPHSFLTNGYRGLFPRGMKLTTYLQLVSMSRELISLLPLYSMSSWRSAFYVLFSIMFASTPRLPKRSHRLTLWGCSPQN
jgi:hypothetical protein